MTAMHDTNPDPTRLVRQQHDYGCGIASLAMVTGQSYDDCQQGWIYDETTIPPTVTKCPGKPAEAPSGTRITRNLPSSQGGRNTDHTQLTAQSTEI